MAELTGFETMTVEAERGAVLWLEASPLQAAFALGPTQWRSRTPWATSPAAPRGVVVLTCAGLVVDGDTPLPGAGGGLKRKDLLPMAGLGSIGVGLNNMLLTFGGTSSDPTVAVCWDADRLNPWRVGIQPDLLLISPAAAKNPDLILWGLELKDRCFAWGNLWESYGLRVWRETAEWLCRQGPRLTPPTTLGTRLPTIAPFGRIEVGLVVGHRPSKLPLFEQPVLVSLIVVVHALVYRRSKRLCWRSTAVPISPMRHHRRGTRKR